MSSKSIVRWAVLLLMLCLVSLLGLWSRLENMDEARTDISTQIEALARKKAELEMEVRRAEREVFRYQKRLDSLDLQMRDRVRRLAGVTTLPTVYFITPTAFRLEQKADLVRLSQTLAQVPSLLWIVVEDSDSPSRQIRELLERSGVKFVHLAVRTPPSKKMTEADPSWLLPRGVPQRNLALQYIRSNAGSEKEGVVYFGDDDNTYDWRLFEELRRVKRAGTWPVGVVAGLIVERVKLDINGTVVGHTARWKTERPFPLDMAGFAVNITLILLNPQAGFKYNVPRGYQESYFLQSCGLNDFRDLEPLADMGRKVYVWHTRTERMKLEESEKEKLSHSQLTSLERDAIAID